MVESTSQANNVRSLDIFVSREGRMSRYFSDPVLPPLAHKRGADNQEIVTASELERDRW
jgi:hypothetical protein